MIALWIIAICYISPITNAGDPTFFIRDMKDNRDIGAFNENFRNVSDGIKKIDLTQGGDVTGNLTVSGTLSVTGAVTLSSAVTNNGNLIQNSVLTQNGNAIFGASVTINGDVYGYWASSRVNVVAITSAQTLFGTCVATLTITGNGLPTVVGFSGTMAGTNLNNEMGWGFLVNGAYVDAFGSTNGATIQENIATDVDYNLSGSYLYSGATGSTNYCLQIACGAAACTTTLGGGGGSLSGASWYYVYEVGSK